MPVTDAQHCDFLNVKNLGMTFGNSEDAIVAVEDVSFSVAQGEIVSVIGPSGCGKSTLLNAIGGLIRGFEGSVSLSGETISGPHPSIGMVFQEESAFPWRTVLENIAFPLEISGMPKSERLERARHFVSLVGLEGFDGRYPSELSGGMRQRVAIARALAYEPKILLMDEPFAALDEQTRILLGESILQIQQSLRQTILLITHRLNLLDLADEVIFLENGVSAEQGAMKELLARRGRFYAFYQAWLDQTGKPGAPAMSVAEFSD